ncbi:MAG TPA: ribosome rescue GTPase HflX [Gammaproteobacteria bacterium]|nr:ribosome rescue GTPase HflX [Gammaproteobacteria bacterium]
MLERPDTGERVLLVHVKARDPRLNADLVEFKELALSAGAIVIDTVTASRDNPDAKFMLGTGKVEEIKQLIAPINIDLVLVNHDLSASQERNLEQEWKCRVVDRTGLILDIFAQRARTFEGKLQVELAQLQHASTRLIRGWTHLERQKGGIGLRGPGETQLEEDRRVIRVKIRNIEKRLEKVQQQRAQNRRSRIKAQIPTVSLVGYTNSGKSTLFRALTHEDVYIANQLFATLDPTLRTISLAHVGKTIIADTVGFIRELPHNLVEAFKATLEETAQADLLLHVIDCSDELWREKKIQVEAVLHQIGSLNVPLLEVYNKIDLVPELTTGLERDHKGNITVVRVSAKENLGLEELLHAIAERICSDVVKGKIQLTPSQAKIRSYLYEVGAIDHEETDAEGNYHLDITLQKERWDRLCKQFADLAGMIPVSTNKQQQHEE